MSAANLFIFLILITVFCSSHQAWADYFPPPESKGGWRKLDDPDGIRQLAGMDPTKLGELKDWLMRSDKRNFAAVVIRNGYIVLEIERGNSSKTDARRVASVSKAICATVLAIASEQSQRGKTSKKMSFDDPAFEFIPWARPLSDPRKAEIKVKQLLNHTSGICPEATGAPNSGTWEYILGHSGDERTAKLAFDPGTACGYSTHALAHAALVCETVTGKPYDQFAMEALFKPIGCEHWWFQHYEGGKNIGRHPSHGMGMPARDLARIGYCMLHNGKWNEQQVIPKWFVEQTAQPTHDVKTPELRFKVPAQTFSHGWELPARLTGEGGTPSGKDIPADARYKPGSGGQLIGFVPSLDLVITRQTGSSGQWEYAEYMRRACAAVINNRPDGQTRRNESGITQEKDMDESVNTIHQFDWQTATPESQGMSGQKLDALKDSLKAKNTKALLIIRNDRIVYEWYASDHGPQKRHYTASLAKALVGGVCLAIAMNDGRIALDDRVAKHVSQWKDHPEKSKITIRHLGSHTSGLDEPKPKDQGGWRQIFWERQDPPDDPFSISRDRPRVLFEPGTQIHYSNAGIAMLSYAITATLKDAPEKDLRTMLRDRVMRPIGVPDEAWSVGYGQTFTVDDLPLVAPWGGGGYTARAAARVGRLMLRKGNWEGIQLISEEAVQLTTNGAGLPGSCGMGWWTNADGRFEKLPTDAFWGSGAEHQTLLVVPSLSLVCVRNGGSLLSGKTESGHAQNTFLFEPLLDAIMDTD